MQKILVGVAFLVIMVLIVWLAVSERIGVKQFTPSEQPQIAIKSKQKLDERESSGNNLVESVPNRQPVEIPDVPSQSLPSDAAPSLTTSIYTNLSQQEEKALWDNHQSLLNTQQIIFEKLEKLAEDDTNTVSVEDLQEWTAVLYRDALLTRIFTEEDMEDSKREQLEKVLEQQIEIPDLTLLQAKTSFLNRNYVRSLNKLLADAYQEKVSELEPPKILDLAYRTKDLLKRRKRHSDNYQKGKMRLFLRDESNSLSEKIEFMQPFLQQNDDYLLRYGAKYFRELPAETQMTESERNSISELMDRVDRRKK